MTTDPATPTPATPTPATPAPDNQAPDDPAPGGTGPARTQALALAVASGLGALSNFVIMAVMTRTLPGQAMQAEALAFWSVLTGLFAVLVGVQNESTRATAAVARGRSPVAALLGPALTIGLVTAVIVAAAAPFVTAHVLPSHRLAAAALLVATALAYAVYALCLGSMAGRGRWSALAGSLTGEVVVRTAAVVGVALVLPSLLGYEVAMAAAVLIVLAALLVLPVGRGAVVALGDRAPRAQVRLLGLAVLSTSATAVMITGYPALMKAALSSGPRGPEPQLAAWMLAVSITRAPVMMPLVTFQQVAVARFVAQRDQPLRALALPVAIVAGLGAVAALGAGLLGSWLLRFFNPEFAIGGGALALLTLASTAMAVLMLLGTAALALDGHRVYAWGWALASVVSVALLFALDVSVLVRLMASLVLGPLAGAVVIIGWLIVQSRRSTPSAA